MKVHAENESKKQVIWYVDTGCDNYIIISKSSFGYLTEIFHFKVCFGDLSIENIMGKDNINFKIKNWYLETISNVFYISSLKIICWMLVDC